MPFWSFVCLSLVPHTPLVLILVRYVICVAFFMSGSTFIVLTYCHKRLFLDSKCVCAIKWSYWSPPSAPKYDYKETFSMCVLSFLYWKRLPCMVCYWQSEVEKKAIAFRSCLLRCDCIRKGLWIPVLTLYQRLNASPFLHHHHHHHSYTSFPQTSPMSFTVTFTHF